MAVLAVVEDAVVANHPSHRQLVPQLDLESDASLAPQCVGTLASNVVAGRLLPVAVEVNDVGHVIAEVAVAQP